MNAATVQSNMSRCDGAAIGGGLRWALELHVASLIPDFEIFLSLAELALDAVQQSCDTPKGNCSIDGFLALCILALAVVLHAFTRLLDLMHSESGAGPLEKVAKLSKLLKILGRAES